MKRAPEIAEEILAKVAGLPKSLQSFPRELLEKQAADRREKLELPKPMTLADLQKTASDNQVDLPKIASVKPEEFSSIAADLVKIAERQSDDSEDVMLTAIAIVAQRHLEKEAAAKVPKAPKAAVLKPSITAHATPAPVAPAAQPWHAPAAAAGPMPAARPAPAAPGVPAPVPKRQASMRPPPSHAAAAASGNDTPGLMTRLKAKVMGSTSPAGYEVQKYHLRQQAELGQLQKKVPNPAQEAMQAEHAEAAAKRQHSSERSDKFLAAAPTMMLAAGTPLAAAAALRPREREKKEEVKIYK